MVKSGGDGWGRGDAGGAALGAFVLWEVERDARGHAMLGGQIASAAVGRMVMANGAESEGQGRSVGEGKVQPGGCRV